MHLYPEFFGNISNLIRKYHSKVVNIFLICLIGVILFPILLVTSFLPNSIENAMIDIYFYYLVLIGLFIVPLIIGQFGISKEALTQEKLWFLTLSIQFQTILLSIIMLFEGLYWIITDEMNLVITLILFSIFIITGIFILISILLTRKHKKNLNVKLGGIYNNLYIRIYTIQFIFISIMASGLLWAISELSKMG